MKVRLRYFRKIRGKRLKTKSGTFKRAPLRATAGRVAFLTDLSCVPPQIALLQKGKPECDEETDDWMLSSDASITVFFCVWNASTSQTSAKHMLCFEFSHVYSACVHKACLPWCSGVIIRIVFTMECHPKLAKSSLSSRHFWESYCAHRVWQTLPQ